MMDQFGSVTREVGPTMDMVGKLSVRALDTLPLPLLVILFLACIFLLNLPMGNHTLLPTHSPTYIDKDRLSPLPPSPSSHLLSTSPSPSSPHFNLGVFNGSPQYVAVVATGRRSSRFREWRSTSLESVQELDEKREEEV